MVLARSVAVVALLAALSGCGEKKVAKTDDQRTASGQILPASISDGMIPYDALTSQPPIAPPKAKPASAATGADSAEAPPPEDGQPVQGRPDNPPRAD